MLRSRSRSRPGVRAGCGRGHEGCHRRHTISVRGRFPTEGRRHGEDIVARFRRATGQLNGMRAMYKDGRYCIDVFDQRSAVAAAVDSDALLVLEDHVNACVREAMTKGSTEAKVDELLAAVRRCAHRR